jgi:hypothetical protein
MIFLQRRGVIMKMPFVECMLCHEMIAAALMQHRVPVCADCARDVSAQARVQARINLLYQQLTDAIAGLCTCSGDAQCTCVDAERYHQVWIAQMQLRAPVPSSLSPAEKAQAMQQRDKLNRQLLNTRKKGDRISDIMRMRDSVDAQASLLNTLELAQLALEADHA